MSRLPSPYLTVSVLMPVWNAARYLADAVESVIAQQTEVDWELLIIDDGSIDTSLDTAQRCARRAPGRIHVLRHADGANHGASASRNLALAHARGSLLAFLDADDVWLPDMLATQLALLHRHPEAAMVYANAERTWDMALPCTAAHHSLGYNRLPALLPPGAAEGLLAPMQPLTWFLEDETLVPCTCTVLVRSDAARAVGGFEDCFAGLYDDQAFYAKLMLRYQVAVQDRCVARYRHHAASCCVQSWEDQAQQQRARRDFEQWLAEHAQSSNLLALAAD